jgi:hypothetical protein
MLPDVESLLNTRFPASLGPEKRSGVLEEKELNSKVDEVFRGTSPSRENQQLIRALLLLWHDHLEPAHSIAQEIHNADGSFVHGIMHRREPDYSNAGYWFRRAGQHGAFPELGKRVSQMLEAKKNSALQAQLLPRGTWDPFGFIDACEHAQGDTERALLEDIQAVETRVLLEHFSR